MTASECAVGKACITECCGLKCVLEIKARLKEEEAVVGEAFKAWSEKAWLMGTICRPEGEGISMRNEFSPEGRTHIHLTTR